jgi:hypothetical protein
MHFKGVFARKRPSTLEPMLMPPISLPGHASYPSGHATQAYLIARCAKLLFSGDRLAKLDADLDALAQRIAWNREIAGLHYPSDSAAGKELAEQIYDYIIGDYESGQPELERLETVLDAAKREWRDDDDGEAEDGPEA